MLAVEWLIAPTILLGGFVLRGFLLATNCRFRSNTVIVSGEFAVAKHANDPVRSMDTVSQRLGSYC